MDAPLIEAIAAEAIPKCNEFHSQCIANTAWAFSKLGVKDSTLMAALSAEAIRKIND